MHNPESVQENETHNILWNFELQTDHLISVRRDPMIVNKKDNLPNSGLCCSGRSKLKLKESEKRNNYKDLPMELKKRWNMKVTVIPFVIGALGTKGWHGDWRT